VWRERRKAPLPVAAQGNETAAARARTQERLQKVLPAGSVFACERSNRPECDSITDLAGALPASCQQREVWFTTLRGKRNPRHASNGTRASKVDTSKNPRF
jgi:hypothetical protein